MNLHLIICLILKGLQEATGELVSKLTNNMDQTVQNDRVKDAEPSQMTDLTPADAVGFTSDVFEFEYTFKVTKDLYVQSLML